MLSLKTIIDNKLYFKLTNIHWESQKHMGYLAEFHYNQYKGVLLNTPSIGSWNDLIQEELLSLPSLENQFRSTISEIHSIIKNYPEHIPEGPYCYNGSYSCPYHYSNPFAGQQSSGICLFLNEYDSDEGLGLLWDMVKSCHINDEE